MSFDWTAFYVVAGILFVSALIAATWAVLDAWSAGNIRKAERDAHYYYRDEPLPPEWVNDSPRVCPPRPRRHTYRDRCNG